MLSLPPYVSVQLCVEVFSWALRTCLEETSESEHHGAVPNEATCYHVCDVFGIKGARLEGGEASCRVQQSHSIRMPVLVRNQGIERYPDLGYYMQLERLFCMR